MTSYEKIINRMRKEAKKGSSSQGLCYAQAISDKEIQIGDLKLDSDFFVVCKHVDDIKKDDVLICSRMDDEYIIIGKVG